VAWLDQFDDEASAGGVVERLHDTERERDV
jgi:hypothetical protein